MTVSQDPRMAQIEDVLPTIGWIEDANQEQNNRTLLTVWAQTAPAKRVQHIVNVIRVTRFSD